VLPDESPPENLVVTSGADGTRTSISPDRPWTVGRAGEADIVVSGDQVSRRHLVLERVSGQWFVRDISSNGSWHNGTRMGGEAVLVPPGGELHVNLGDRAGPQLVVAHQAAVPAGAPVPVTATADPSRRRRRYRLVGIALAVLLLLLVIADRVSAHVASTEAVSQIVQKSQDLADRPSVSFGGFPFLTQVAFGKYTDIHVGMHNITPTGSLRIDSISAHLRGAHVPLATVMNGDLKTIPVDEVTATVAMRYADLNAFLAHQPGHLKLAQRKGALQVTGTVDEDGETFEVSGAAKLAVDDGGLVISPTSLHVKTGGPLDDILGDASDVLGDVLSAFPPVPVPMPGLPFNLRLTSVHSDDNGLVASGAADKVVLPAG
jgi:hypothetical protein